MSLDLYERETADKMGRLQPVRNPDVGVFDGFVRGTGLATMKGFAKTARAIDMLGAVGPIVQDRITGGTVAQDRYFREHDETFGSAVDYWTAKPGEVGVAAEIVGSLVSTLPQVVASPALAVGATQLATAEDLVEKGVDATRAQAVGAAQGAGLGLGIWMPILGKNLWQRVVVGGAGFNALQGVATRGVSEAILKDTPAADDYKAFDPASLTLDVLLGAMFGGITHLSPAQRAQGKAAWERIERWGTERPTSDVEAVAALRQAQHLNVDSAPGRLEAPADVEAHVNRVRTAIDQLATGRPVDVSDMPAPKANPDAARWEEANARARDLADEADSEALFSTLGDDGVHRMMVGLRRGETLGHVHGILRLFDPVVEKTLERDARHSVRYDVVDEAAAARLQSVVSGDLSGYRHSIDADAIRHILKSHGPDAKHGKLDVPVHREDFSLIPEIVRNPDRIEAGGTDEKGRKLVRYMKRFGGAVFLVEEIRRGREELAVKTMYKKKPPRGSMDSGEPEPRTQTPEAHGGLPKSIPEPDGSPANRAAGTPPSEPGAPARPAATGEAKADPVAMEAQRIAQERPDMVITVGLDPEGSPIRKSVKDFLDDARGERARTVEELKLIQAAAECMLGVG